MKKMIKSKILVAGHRGNMGEFPENTLISFQSAIDSGVDMIETDIHMTKDGELVLIHDSTVDRTTDGTGYIKDMTLKEIKRLDAGIKKNDKFKGERVPTLIEFLEATKGNSELLYNFELKDYPHEVGEELAKQCADKVIALVEEYNLADRCVLNSFSGEILEYIDEKYDRKYALHGFYPFFILGKCKRNPIDYLYCACLFHVAQDNQGKWVGLEGAVPEKEWFDYLISNGVEPWMGANVEKKEDFEQAIKFGTKLFTTNTPKKAIEILRDLGVR